MSASARRTVLLLKEWEILKRVGDIKKSKNVLSGQTTAIFASVKEHLRIMPVNKLCRILGITAHFHFLRLVNFWRSTCPPETW